MQIIQEHSPGEKSYHLGWVVSGREKYTDGENLGKNNVIWWYVDSRGDGEE